MALLYNVVAYIWHLRKYFFESSGANPGSIPKNFIDLSNSWSVASYIYDPLHPTPHPLKKTATITRTTTTNQIVRVTLLENFPTHFVSAFFFNSYPSPFLYSQWIPWLLRYLHRQSSHRTADNWSCWCSTWRLHINLLKAPHLKVGRLAFETITGKFRPQKHHWRSHLVRQVCMWCNQVIILQDPGTENTTIVSSYSTDHVSLWSHDLSWLFSCSLMGKPSGVVRSWATHNGLI